MTHSAAVAAGVLHRASVGHGCSSKVLSVQAQGESAKPRRPEVEADILWGSPPADEAELDTREAVLTQPVPLLLEAMNSAAAEVNALEQQMVDVREQCLRLTRRNDGAAR